MSYILDALNRAEAERGRGSVPGLHARQATSAAPDGAASARRRIWLGVGAVLALGLAAAGWWVWPTAEGNTRPLAVPSPGVPTPSQISAPMTTLPVAPAPAIQPAATTPPTTAPVRATATTAVAAAVPEPMTKLASVVTTPATSVAAAQAPPRTPLEPVVRAVPPAVATPATVPLLSELSEDIRRQIPALAITGAVYSNNPGQRLLLVNNLVLTQGSQAAPELMLAEIGEHSSVFDFRGTRFRLAH